MTNEEIAAKINHIKTMCGPIHSHNYMGPNVGYHEQLRRRAKHKPVPTYFNGISIGSRSEEGPYYGFEPTRKFANGARKPYRAVTMSWATVW
jgi:hypothetical protein